MSEPKTQQEQADVESLTDEELALIVWKQLNKEFVIYVDSYVAEADHELRKRFPK